MATVRRRSRVPGPALRGAFFVWAVAWLALRVNAQELTVPYSIFDFSFRYAGIDSATLLDRWQMETDVRQLTGVRPGVTWRDPKTGLAVRWDRRDRRPAVEWTVYLRNEGNDDTPIVSDLRAADFVIETTGPVVLNHNTGSANSATDYEPLRTALVPGKPVTLAPVGGRSSNGTWPYFNIEWEGGGAIVAVGWPGQWSAEFSKEDATHVRIRAGQELTHLSLRPGEEIRTPLIVFMPYEGDRTTGQNLWRRYMLRYASPGGGGRMPPTVTAACASHQVEEMMKADEANQKLFVDRYLEEGIKLDYWWMDAGWYVNYGAWPNTGTWRVDDKRFPNGLRAITDHARRKGVKSLLWFEPERVHPGTELYTRHPDWLLGKDGGDKLLNLGNPGARAWVTDMVDRTLREQGIDLFRCDFNFDPLPYWRDNDPEDRQGMTENLYVQGFLAWWEALRDRRPGLWIDTCASGGRRNDIETLRIAKPLLRSDYILEPIGQQLHTYGLAQWVPYYGTGVNALDAYTFRSAMCPWFTLCYDVRRKDIDYASLRKLWGQWKDLAPLMGGDFYPLTEYRKEPDQWMAWQFDVPEKGEGFVQAFRRPTCDSSTLRVKLRGLDPNGVYVVTDIDQGPIGTLTGHVLMGDGLTIEQKSAPGAAVLRYRRRP